VRIAARGGNWGMDDSRKRVSIEHLEPFFRLHRDAHVNIIRDWMGQNTEENFYALADKYGLMVWNDFWESTQNYNLEAQDPALFLKNARDSILRFRIIRRSWSGAGATRACRSPSSTKGWPRWCARSTTRATTPAVRTR
jgi:beta-galactosidase/beta-glucuronidase